MEVSTYDCQALSDSKTYTYSDLDLGFTPPKSCLEHRYTSAPDGYDHYESSTAVYTTDIYISLDVYRGRNPACFPPNFPAACSYTGTFTQDIAQPYMDLPGTSQPGIMVAGMTWSETHYVYSPASCPGDYAPVSTGVDASHANLTSAICCPMQFSLVSDTICRSHCSSAVLENRTMTFSSSVMNLFAPTVKVAWDSSDMVRWRMAPATSTPTVLLPEPTSTVTSDGTSSGLSQDARVGIAVGVSATVTTAIVIALFFWRRRVKRSKVPKEDVDPHKAELPGEGKKHVELADEAGLCEAEASDKPKEVAEQCAPAELASEWTGWEAPNFEDVRSDLERRDGV